MRRRAFWFALSLHSTMERKFFGCGVVFGVVFFFSYLELVALGYCKPFPHRVSKPVGSPLLGQALGCCPLPWPFIKLSPAHTRADTATDCDSRSEGK